MIDLLKKLISFNSTTPHNNGAIAFIANYLSSYGFDVIIKEFGSQKIANLYANKGKGKNICFAGHIDVVPPGPQDLWTNPPFVSVEKEGRIYGRGAVDMKGGLAAQIKSAVDFITNNPNHNNTISFLITSDEEGDAEYGSKSMLEYLYNNNYCIDFAIIAEPTCKNNLGDVIKIGSRGSANFSITVSGTQGHVAYTDNKDNPAHILSKALNNLINYKFDDKDNDFPASTIQITSIDIGNNTTNLVPKKASAKFNIRFNNSYTSDALLSLVTNILKQYTSDFAIDMQCNSHPYCADRSSNYIVELKNVIKKITNISPEIVSSGATSDARFFINYCTVVEFGLKYHFAHMINENVEIIDLQTLYRVYYKMLERL